MKTGLLIVNLGSPRSPTVPGVRSFLKEFLMDPYVIDIPTPIRWLLVNYIALTRPKSVVPKYKSIWTKLGSPLFVNTHNFKNKLEALLKEKYVVEIGMRYGSPSIKQALESFAERNITQVTVFQMYPQQAYSSTFTNEALINEISKKLNLQIKYVPAFYNHSGFIKSLAAQVRTSLKDKKWEYIIMSYHGVPIRQITKQQAAGSDYQGQCHETSRLLALELNLKPDQYTVSFQSRLTQKWIEPFTDQVLVELPKKGIKDIAIISPSFVCDCLETLEELEVQERQRFSIAGGHIYTYIPCLNDQEMWVDVAKEMVLQS